MGLLAALACLLWQHINISRLARAIALKQCQKQHLLLLDQSVILLKVRLRMSKKSLLSIERKYGFEFSTTGDQRYLGELQFSGKKLERIELQAHKI